MREKIKEAVFPIAKPLLTATGEINQVISNLVMSGSLSTRLVGSD